MRIGSRGFLVASAVGLAVLVAIVGTASAQGPPPGIAAGPAFGFVPSHNADHAGRQGRQSPLQYHGGPVQHSTTVIPVFWGSSWTNGTFVGDKISGLDTLYSGVGGTPYAHTNVEYTDGTGHVDTVDIKKGGDLKDPTATPSGAPTTSDVLAAVARAIGGNSPIAGAYYPVYSDQPRGNASYCAWHSTGTIKGIQVQFGFFFNLDGDPGCDPGASPGHSQGLAALANVSGHELSEMLTDPQLNAWYDQRGNENADKCAWTFQKPVTIGGEQWLIQENWSNAAGGCIQTS